ncbi:jg3277 [Pararge aegeria aegeria]|uniref:Jg3277 protein n=1 Tax=Pararge aegeria aegeria TaxID=348720 RepID=A0A8S4RTS8_9NEOP|nr:jg3277 [Pararge aegeria aegeria]
MVTHTASAAASCSAGFQFGKLLCFLGAVCDTLVNIDQADAPPGKPSPMNRVTQGMQETRLATCRSVSTSLSRRF